MGAWIEIMKKNQKDLKIIVAPLVGAWIEIVVVHVFPAWHIVAPLVGAWIEIVHMHDMLRAALSLPLWERGLKLIRTWESIGKIVVAPLVGAWIEIHLLSVANSYIAVAPLVGAWIEICYHRRYTTSDYLSLPLWERGLKSVEERLPEEGKESLPLWERGLKWRCE